MSNPLKAFELDDIKRGEVWQARLNAIDESETSQITPCVVVQIDEMNKSSVLGETLVIPLSRKIPRPEERTVYDVILHSSETGLPHDMIALWPLLSPVHPSRFLKRTGQIHHDKTDRLAELISQLVGAPKPEV